MVGAMNSVRLALVVASCALCAGAVAQTVEKKGKDAPPAAVPAAGQAAPPQARPAGAPAPGMAPPPGQSGATTAGQQGQAPLPPGIPDGYKLNLLIRTTVIAVNQANKTGNYSVLRDLAAPGFQSVNNPAQLAEIFSDLRKKNLDLSPVLFYQPKFTSRPMLLPNGMLRVSGLFPSRPQQVTFDLIFEQVQGDWRLYGVSIGARQAPSPEAQVNAPGAAGGAVADQGTATGGSTPTATANTGKAAPQGAGIAPAGEKGAGIAPAAAPKAAAGKEAPVAVKPVSPPASQQGLGAPAEAP